MGQIAGLEVGLPAGVDDVTAGWMTSVLRTSGAIAPDATVTSIANERYIAGGLLSVLYRSTVAYDQAGGPATVIVKFPSDVPAQRAMAEAFDVYHREIAFYRDIAATVAAERADMRAA